jgi:hypothetical protein
MKGSTPIIVAVLAVSGIAAVILVGAAWFPVAAPKEEVAATATPSKNITQLSSAVARKEAVAKAPKSTTAAGGARIPVETLREGIGKIKNGWTKEQVIEVLGQPADPRADVWTYLSEYWATSMYTQYEIKFLNNRLLEVKGYGGCDYLVPPHEQQRQSLD